MPYRFRCSFEIYRVINGSASLCDLGHSEVSIWPFGMTSVHLCNLQIISIFLCTGCTIHAHLSFLLIMPMQSVSASSVIDQLLNTYMK